MEEEKIKLKITVSFSTEVIISMSDYPDCKTVDDIIAMEKAGVTDEPQFIIDGGELAVSVEQVK